MAAKLLNTLTRKFHNGVKKRAAETIGFKVAAFQHFLNGRPVRDFVIIHLRHLYGRAYNNNGITDTELLDLLEEDYSEQNLKKLMGRYK